MTLMLHCGGSPATYEDLVELPDPESMGPRHAPQRFDTVVHELMGGFVTQGLKVCDEAFGLNAKRTQLFGLFRLEGLVTDGTSCTAVGLRASVDQTLPIGIAIGDNPFVCDNLAFSAEFTLSTKSTTFVERRLGGLVAEATSNVVPWVAQIKQEQAEWAEAALTDEQASRIMIAALRTGLVPGSRFKEWLGQYDEAAAREHRPLRGTKLGLFHACTAALRGHQRLDSTIGRTLGLRSLFNWDGPVHEWEKPRIGAGARKLITNDAGEDVWVGEGAGELEGLELVN